VRIGITFLDMSNKTYKFSILNQEQIYITALILDSLQHGILRSAVDNVKEEFSTLKLDSPYPLCFLDGWSLYLLSLTHHTHNFVFLCLSPLGENFVFKIQSSQRGEVNRLSAEAEFYRKYQGCHFPRLLAEIESKPFTGVVLEYIGSSDKLSSFMWLSILSQEESRRTIDDILDYLITELFLKNIRKLHHAENRDVLRRFFIQRLYARLTKAEMDNLEFQKVLKLKTVHINSVDCLGPLALLRRIDENIDRLASIYPLFLGSIHGDPHFGNILYTSGEKLINSNFYFIDPGPHLVGPLVYDIGKVYQTFLGHYEAIIRRAYKLSRHRENTFQLTFKEPAHFVQLCEYLRQTMLKRIHDNNIDHLCERFHLSAKLAMGLHLMAASPHHIAISEEALAMLLIGNLTAYQSYSDLMLPQSHKIKGKGSL
jgi:hypothetical protein